MSTAALNKRVKALTEKTIFALLDFSTQNITTIYYINTIFFRFHLINFIIIRNYNVYSKKNKINNFARILQVCIIYSYVFLAY